MIVVLSQYFDSNIVIIVYDIVQCVLLWYSTVVFVIAVIARDGAGKHRIVESSDY